MDRVAIVDYGMGNLLSVHSAFLHLGADAEIVTDPSHLARADRVVLPGVGAFRDCMAGLRAGGWVEPLNQAAMVRRLPTMGICLGMQAMARASEEGGRHEGLGWFPADVVRLRPSDAALRVPHVGWNDLLVRPGCPLLEGLPPQPDFYFVHTYWMRCDDPRHVAAECDYGGLFTAAVMRDNLFATQFHPEKSQENGLHVLERFLAWRP